MQCHQRLVSGQSILQMSLLFRTAHKNAGLFDVFARANIINQTGVLFSMFPGIRENFFAFEIKIVPRMTVCSMHRGHAKTSRSANSSVALVQ